MTTTTRTWDQGVLGGGFIRIHSETIGGISYIWECDHPSDCDDCHNYEREVKR